MLEFAQALLLPLGLLEEFLVELFVVLNGRAGLSWFQLFIDFCQHAKAAPGGDRVLGGPKNVLYQ